MAPTKTSGSPRRRTPRRGVSPPERYADQVYNTPRTRANTPPTTSGPKTPDRPITGTTPNAPKRSGRKVASKSPDPVTPNQPIKVTTPNTPRRDGGKGKVTTSSPSKGSPRARKAAMKSKLAKSKQATKRLASPKNDRDNSKRAKVETTD